MVRRHGIHAHETEKILYLLQSRLDWNSDNKKCTSYGIKSQRAFNSTMFNLVGIIRTKNRERLQQLEQDERLCSRKVLHEFVSFKCLQLLPVTCTLCFFVNNTSRSRSSHVGFV
jgi:hypothetical protein